MKTPSDTIPLTFTKGIGMREIDYRQKYSALAFEVAKAVENYLNRKSKFHETDLTVIFRPDLHVPKEALQDVCREPEL